MHTEEEEKELHETEERRCARTKNYETFLYIQTLIAMGLKKKKQTNFHTKPSKEETFELEITHR